MKASRLIRERASKLEACILDTFIALLFLTSKLIKLNLTYQSYFCK